MGRHYRQTVRLLYASKSSFGVITTLYEGQGLRGGKRSYRGWEEGRGAGVEGAGRVGIVVGVCKDWGKKLLLL